MGDRSISLSYDGKGNLKSMRQAKVPGEPKSLGLVLTVRDFAKGDTVFKTAKGLSGWESYNGTITSGTVYDDTSSQAKKVPLQEWVDECARVIAGEQETIGV